MVRLTIHRVTLILVMIFLTACQVAPVTTPATASTPTDAITATSIPSITLTLTYIPSPSFTPSLTSTLIPSPTPSATHTPPPAEGIQLLRGPYLQAVTTDSVVVVWDTNQEIGGSVAYGATDLYGLQQDDLTPAKKHAVTLSGLKPYTTYYYRIETDLGTLGGGYTFRTAASPEQTSFSFAVIGDTRSQHDVHLAVVNRMVEMKPDFYLHLGDLVESGLLAGDWATFFQIEGPLMASAPIYPVLGNHETDSPLYFDAFDLPNNERWYTFTYGNARFIALEIDGYQGIVDPLNRQFKWLEETLASNTLPWVFVLFHAPINTMLAVEPNWLDNTLVPLFEKYQVSAVFSGHYHNYQRREVNGITYIISGGGGAPLYDVAWGSTPPLVYASVYEAVFVTIEGKNLTAVVQTPDGSEVDRFSLSIP